MNPTTSTDPQTVLHSLRQRFAESADGVLEAIAREQGLSTLDVVSCLPAECCTRVNGEHFQAIMDELSEWGEILLIVHTPDAIIECGAPLPKVTTGRGFYNFEHGSPIRGHIRLDACAEICLIRRPFMGMETCSVQFFNAEGNAIFKVFVGRGEDDVLDAGQVRRFEALRERFNSAVTA